MDARLGDRVQALHDLKRTRGWAELAAIYEEKRADWAQQTASDLLRTGEIDQRGIDFHRGYFQAWREILAQPEKAEKRFEKALRQTEGN